MAIVHDALMALAIPDATQTYGEADCILYALGVGLGADPTDEAQLRFLVEPDVRALPTMPVVLASPGDWLRDLPTGVDHLKVVHGEEALTLHRPVPSSGTLVGRTRVVDLIDKGAGRGAIVVSERVISDAATGEPLASTVHTVFCRGDGGFGGPSRPSVPPPPLPDRVPDAIIDLPTMPQAALIYRLSRDRNPLHADPEMARRAGFPRPILHGLATFGIAGHALLQALCDYDPAGLAAISGRFTAPAFPGETFRTEIWREGSTVAFRTRVVERDVVVLGNGRAMLTG